ncbi:tryptophan halogenase family protein [Asticcacaulis solisilvae]|uniref:tryptophan halogenase family protein n=1 Tax=Asticcacaulis solisilvae TaxID=1217274 RepID=UPI003FD8CE24
MNAQSPLKVVIVGGGTAGYMLAASITRTFKPQSATVRLIESSDIAIVGVGESTLPQVRDFNDFLGVDEVEFMRETNATFKLAIEFRDWARQGDIYFHPFGVHGHAIQGVPFLQCWLRARANGHEFNIDDFSYPSVASREQKFEFPDKDRASIRSTYSYAYHFDAYLYAAYLRRWSEKRGLVRTEGTVVDVALRPEDGHIKSLTLSSGEVVEGDIFIDCSGFRGVMINQALKVGFEDWSSWLPCDRAWALSTDLGGDFNATTRCTAREAGWQWRIPLQRRFGTGYVFSSRFTTEERAREVLYENLDGAPQEAEPRLIRFQSGRRKTSWYKNCIALGLAAGFLEPLESTSIYMSQIAVSFLMRLFPGQTVDPALADEYNRLVDIEYARVRDFLILHYHATAERTGPLWEHVHTMELPESLTEKMEVFKRRGHIHRYRDGLFSPASWTAIYTGQRLLPDGYDPQADNIDFDSMLKTMTDLRGHIAENVAGMRSHRDFVDSYCMAPEPRASRGQARG